MARTDSLIRELDKEAATTRRVLDRVPLEKGEWQPHPKSMSLGRLAGWLAGAPGWVAGVIGRDGFDLAKWEPLPVPRSREELLTTFDSGVHAAREAVSRLDDAAAAGPWSFRMAGKTLNTYTRLEAAWLFLLSDAIHHRGQLSVYLRLLDVPVPSIYGPSADENPYF